MRWHRLFDDLEAQLARQARQELEAEIVEHTRAERGQVTLTDRLTAGLGSAARLKVWGLGWLDVRVVDVGDGWLLCEGEGGVVGRARELLVPSAAVLGVEGAAEAADTRRSVASRRFGLTHALRAISRDRAPVRAHDRAGDHLTGTIDRVLADHLDLSRHADDEARRAVAVRGVVSLPYAALAAVRRL
ncbi:hypothetical protein [Ornithinimicrobium tianjinense]|uniref:Uncharacterized protein n=1 Tax=Ornithinimicrobium tianjinense TaxID=1195761 RepID=A0A917BJF2_9MICO|nr:hypothetical protein [Ornithinimicrobium tianjinense]GGF43142.1 hypothetical protein GCM10011366_08750 [Ornithinimicrobium tianjinense]